MAKKPAQAKSDPSSQAVTIRSAYSPRVRVPTLVPGESLTHQSFRDSANINNIVSRFEKTGLLPQTNKKPMYGYIPDLDLREAMQLITEAQQNFMNLPSALRKRFGNDPVNFVEFCQNPENLSEAVSLGLVDESLLGPAGTGQPASGASAPDGAASAPPAEPSPDANSTGDRA